MPALESISIKGFKSIREVEVPLRDINVLIGANGSGKSNFLDVLSFLQAVHAGDSENRPDGEELRQYAARVGGAERILHFGSKVTEEIEIHLRLQYPHGRYRITLTPSDTDTLRLNFLAYGMSSFMSRREFDAIDKLPQDDIEAGSINRLDESRPDLGFDTLVSSWRLYHFHDTNRYLRPDGSNLAAFLYLLREKHEHSYTFLHNTVRQVAPFFDDFVLEPLALNPDTIRLEWKHVGTDDYFDVSSLSDGTLRFIALATLLQQPVELRPSVILLDEPELGLHPLAITILASMVKSASVDTQVILATQSPILLDHFQPEDVLVANRVDGATEFTRLSSEKLALWLEDYSIGELWGMNDIGGRPAPERLSR